MSEHILYIFDEIEGLDEEYLQNSIPDLSHERLSKAFAYRFQLDRILSVTVYLLLRLALRENHGINEPVEFSYNEYGKPFLRDYPLIYFNMSHCRRAAACVISEVEVGVDVQEIAPVSDELAKRTLTATEYAAFKKAENPSRLFCEYWTIKESYLKRTGQGIGTDLTKLSVAEIGEKTVLKESEDYLCCVSGISGQVRYVKPPITLL